MVDFIQAHNDTVMHLIQLWVFVTMPYVIWYTWKD